MTISAFALLDFITSRTNDERREPAIRGIYVTAKEDVPNDYSPDYKTVKAGTVVRCDFGGDFGFYGFADDEGTIRRTRTSLEHVNKFDWTPHEARIG